MQIVASGRECLRAQSRGVSCGRLPDNPVGIQQDIPAHAALENGGAGFFVGFR
jgi:hypothetical protein